MNRIDGTNGASDADTVGGQSMNGGMNWPGVRFSGKNRRRGSVLDLPQSWNSAYGSAAKSPSHTTRTE